MHEYTYKTHAWPCRSSCMSTENLLENTLYIKKSLKNIEMALVVSICNLKLVCTFIKYIIWKNSISLDKLSICIVQLQTCSAK